MNYQILKSIIDSIIKNFKCEACSSNITEWNIEIVWAAWTTLNLDLVCPTCNKHNMVRAEVSHLNMGQIGDINKIKENLTNALKNISQVKMDNKRKDIKIDDKEIIDLRKKLKQDNIWVWDIFI